MAILSFREGKLRARRYLATRRVLRLYRDVRRLVDQLAEQADCPKDVTNFRTKVIRLRKLGFIGLAAASKLNRLSTFARKAGTGEIKLSELEQLVQSAAKWHRKLTRTERQTRQLVPLEIIADQFGVTADWIEANWLQREVDPLPCFKWCDGRPFINRDTLRDWRAAQPIEHHATLCEVKGGDLCHAG